MRVVGGRPGCAPDPRLPQPSACVSEFACSSDSLGPPPVTVHAKHGHITFTTYPHPVIIAVNTRLRRVPRAQAAHSTAQSHPPPHHCVRLDRIGCVLQFWSVLSPLQTEHKASAITGCCSMSSSKRHSKENNICIHQAANSSSFNMNSSLD